jgi:wyosine [tRNA(Phe)-imidazoG37] synthetase (radical SAM superfamily)
VTSELAKQSGQLESPPIAMGGLRVPLIVRDHRRTFEDNLYVYAVVSRRSKGVSIGLNLNADKLCNFDCIYCQVDRKTPPVTRDLDCDRLMLELEEMLDLVQSGQLFEMERFRNTPCELRKLNDIAFSGDGEPTTPREFPELVHRVAELKRRRGLQGVKLVLITNATMFHRTAVASALRVLDANDGEIWAKLDAGTDAYYHLVDRTTIPFRQVLDNIRAAARERPIVIQSLFMRVHDVPPTTAELDAYVERLREIVAGGGSIKLVQVYTVARIPTESYVTPLADQEVDAVVRRVQQSAGLPAEAFYGPA